MASRSAWSKPSGPPRRAQGFYKKAELELLIQRRSTRRELAAATINETIVERYYQTRAIRRIGESLEKDRERKALLVMATGSGKTRTVTRSFHFRLTLMAITAPRPCFDNRITYNTLVQERCSEPFLAIVVGRLDK